MRTPARQLAPRAPLHGNYQPRMLDLARDVMQLPCTSSHMDGTIRQGITPSCRTPTTRAGSHDVTRALKKTNLAIRGVLHASTCALPVRNLHRAFWEQNTPRRPRRVLHTCPRKEPVRSEFSTQPDLCPSAGPATSPRAFPDQVYLRNRARGGLARGTARTIRALPCRPGPVPIATTAATRHLSRHSRSRSRHARHTHLRVTMPKLHTIAFPFTPGDTAACSRMATDISRV